MPSTQNWGRDQPIFVGSGGQSLHPPCTRMLTLCLVSHLFHFVFSCSHRPMCWLSVSGRFAVPRPGQQLCLSLLHGVDRCQLRNRYSTKTPFLFFKEKPKSDDRNNGSANQLGLTETSPSGLILVQHDMRTDRSLSYIEHSPEMWSRL